MKKKEKSYRFELESPFLAFSRNKDNPIQYISKSFLTNYEYEFYKKIKEVEKFGFIIIPQVNLAAIVEKPQAKYRSELFRNIDFGIFDLEFNLKLLIELNDKSHQTYTRKNRDLKVRKILNDCKIKLINFYTYYPNEKNYVLNRIYKELDLSETNTENIKKPNS